MATTDVPDYYELLGADRTASAEQIQSAYRTLAQQFHPDRGGNAAMFRLLNQAYATLSNPAERARYDTGAREPSGPKPGGPRPPQRERPRPAPGPPGHNHDVDPDRLEWWSDTDPTAVINPAPAYQAGRSATAASAAVWAALTGTLIAMTWPEQQALAGVLAVTSCIDIIRALLGRLPGRGRRPTILLLAASPLTALLAATLSDSRLLQILIALWAMVWLTAGVLYARYSAARILDRQLPAADLSGFNMWGSPAAAASSPARELAARLAADDLALLCRIPAARIVHSLTDPATAEPIADHAVLCGPRLAVFASRCWAPGDYTIDEAGNPRRQGRPLAGQDITLTAAIRRLKELMTGVEIIGFLLIYPDPPSAPIRVTNSQRPPWLAGSAEFTINAAGVWLHDHPTAVDRRRLVDLIHLARG